MAGEIRKAWVQKQMDEVEKRTTLYERQKKTGLSKSDSYQTPAYALEPLLPYLNPEWHIWEPAEGEGYITRALEKEGYEVLGTDIAPMAQDFLRPMYMSNKKKTDCIVTNPPYSYKDEFIARCYELGKPWALLMPITALEGKKRQAMYREHGLQMIFMDKRINYITPHGGNSGAWFASAWFTHGLNLPNDIMWHSYY